MKHWELTPKQVYTLVRQDGFSMPVLFLFRDTVRAVFKSQGRQREFQLSPDGGLIGHPSIQQQMEAARTEQDFGSPRCFRAALTKCDRWRIVPRR